MFVTNHALAGAVIGRLLSGRPVTAFVVGVGSHLVLDAVPHWGCSTLEPGGAERFLTIARRDGVLGLAVIGSTTLLVDPPARRATVAAMAGSVLLDLDKPVEHFFGRSPFPPVVQELHTGVQRESADGMAKEFLYGLLFVLANLVVPRPGPGPGDRTVSGRPRWRAGPGGRCPARPGR